MINLYVYLVLLLSDIIIIWYCFGISYKHAPQKIKILSILSMSGLLLRGIVLLFMFFSQSANYLYLLKPFVFLNLLCVPLIQIICLYVFIRNDRINFSYAFITGSMFLCIYVLLMYKLPGVVQVSDMYGYVITLLNSVQVSFGFITINAMILVTCILQIGKRGVNNPGVYSVLFTAVICIAETLLNMVGMELVPQYILGDLFCMIALSYALGRLKN